MSYTTINPGLEIRSLYWKDDSFRMADHQPSNYPVTNLPAPMLGWWDLSASNAITFSNNIVTTYGAFSLTYSSAITNGDELNLPTTTTVEKDFPTPVSNTIIDSFRMRAKAVSGIANITINLLDDGIVSVGPPLIRHINTAITVPLTAIYSHFTVPIASFSPAISAPIWGVQLISNASVLIDYVGLASTDYLNQGGMAFDVTIPKRTPSLTVPNNIDIIQQLGIGSRSKAIQIPKVSKAVYKWLEAKMLYSVPIELVTPTQQATGYLSDLKRHSEAGWVGMPLPTTDALSGPVTNQMLYDVSLTLVKADNETSMDTTV